MKNYMYETVIPEVSAIAHGLYNVEGLKIMPAGDGKVSAKATTSEAMILLHDVKRLTLYPRENKCPFYHGTTTCPVCPYRNPVDPSMCGIDPFDS